MAKTIALSPENKSRLRKEVLAGIGQDGVGKSVVRSIRAKAPIKASAPPPAITMTTATVSSGVSKLPSKKISHLPAGRQEKPTTKKSKISAKVKPAKAIKTTKIAVVKKATKAKKSKTKTKTKTKKSAVVFPPAMSKAASTPLGRPLPVISDDLSRPLTAITRGKVGPVAPVAPTKILALPAPFHRVRRMVIGFIVFSALMLIIATATATVGLYRFGWNDRFSQTVAQYLNLPAGTVNGATISLAQYISDSKTIAKAVSEQREGIGAPAINDDDIFNRLASVTLIISELKRYGITLSNEDIDRDLQAIIAQFQDRQAASDAIFKIYNLSIEDFRDKILVAVKARDLLQQQITKDESLAINQAARTEAEAVLRLAQDPAVNFSLLAKQYTQDETGVNTGGDLGWVTKGQNELPAEIENIIFGLAASSTHPTLVKSDIGYHVIRVDERTTDAETGADSAHARHIMIKVDVDEYIKSLFDQAEIVRYIK